MRVKSVCLAWRIFRKIAVAVGLCSQTLSKITRSWGGSVGRNSHGMALYCYYAISLIGLKGLSLSLMFEPPLSRLPSVPFREGINKNSSLLVSFLLNRWL